MRNRKAYIKFATKRNLLEPLSFEPATYVVNFDEFPLLLRTCAIIRTGIYTKSIIMKRNPARIFLVIATNHQVGNVVPIVPRKTNENIVRQIVSGT